MKNDTPTDRHLAPWRRVRRGVAGVCAAAFSAAVFSGALFAEDSATTADSVSTPFPAAAPAAPALWYTPWYLYKSACRIPDNFPFEKKHIVRLERTHSVAPELTATRLLPADFFDAANSTLPPAIFVATETPSFWDFNVDASVISRTTDFDAIATQIPVTFSVTRAFSFHNLTSLRPMVSAGAGVLGQFLEDRIVGDDGFDSQRAFSPLLRVGVGLEWQPSDQVILHFRYDYSHVLQETDLTPGTFGGHSLKAGIEFRF